jgi:dipeptidyl aminopeptidase/acylaminoacyl peptidase
MSSLRLFCAAALGAGLLTAQFRLEQIMAPAFPFELASAASANRVAWVTNGAGPWNVWVAEGPAFKARQLTRYTLEDGQEISSLVVAPDGARVAFVRGGSANRSGDVPNPTSIALGAEQAVWVADFLSGETRRLGDGSDPLFSPDSKRVVWVKGSTVWTSVDGKEAPLMKPRGGASGRAVSPDGAKLAFSSSRSDHAFVGVFDFATQAITWLDPSTDRDLNPVWSPDGKRIVFLRIPSDRAPAPTGARRAGRPWSLRVADVATGTAKEVFKASEGKGSVWAPVSSGPSLVWAKSGQIAFPWERTGWKILYTVPENGGAAKALTPGEFEVEYVEPAAEGTALYVSSNQDDIDRRHLWKVSIDTGKSTLLTAGKGIEWSPAALSNGALAFLRASATAPARPAVRLVSGEIRDLVDIPAEFPENALVEPKAIHFAATDGLEIPGQLFVPKNLKAGEKHPAVVFFHGGSRRQMLLGWNPMYYYHNAYAFNQYLVSRGYIVLSVNYRSGTGYGMEFREALDYGASGASEYRDVAGAGLYLRNLEGVDARRIGLWGGSYGGYLTALGLARASNLFAAGVDLHGVHNWVRDIQDTSSYARFLVDEYQRKAWESSPMSTLDGWRSPVLLIHGDDDRSVIFNQTVQLVEELKKRNVEYEQLIFPDEVHDFLLKSNWLRALNAASDFFDRRLK